MTNLLELSLNAAREDLKSAQGFVEGMHYCFICGKHMHKKDMIHAQYCSRGCSSQKFDGKHVYCVVCGKYHLSNGSVLCERRGACSKVFSRSW